LMLANGGQHKALRFFTADPVVAGPRLLGATTAQLVTHILADPEARRPAFVSGGPLDFDYAVAVKTGTSQGHRDAWTVAYSDRLLVAVWLGNHDWRRMNHVTGVKGAAHVAHRIMDRVMPLREPHRAVTVTFPAPEHTEARQVCALSGALASGDCPHHRVEHFAPGTAPESQCTVHRRLTVDRSNGLLVAPGCAPTETETRVVVDLPPQYQAWARAQRLTVAPRIYSPRCPAPRALDAPFVAITTPSTRTRYLRDPDTPEAFSTVKLVAEVYPPEEDVVWLVDGTPVAKVAWPHEVRLPLTPGKHLIVAAHARMAAASQPVQVTVED
jgi:penicillin-binding protein 1C